MDEKQILQKAVDTVTDKPLAFDIDIQPRNFLQKLLQRWNLKPRKRCFVLKALTLNQVYKISSILLELDAGQLTADDILKLFKQLPKVAEIVAISISPTRSNVDKDLVQFLMDNLDQTELHYLAGSVLEKMKTNPLLITILSLRNLNLMKLKSPVEQVEKIAPGSLSAA